MKLTYWWFGLVAAIGGMTSAAAATYVPENRLWPSGVVPYVYAKDFIPENVVPVEAAMAVWESAINVQFVPRTNQADYVLIRNAGEGNGSSSPTIGRGGGEQALNIRDAIWTWSPTAYTYGLAHELGHVLGLYHTHQRPDRDNYVTVYNDRIDPNFFGNFPIESGSLGYPRNEMDYDSVMAYPECTFSLCENCGADLDNCRVIEISDPAAFAEFQDSMGQRDHLSELDALAMSFMYPQSNWKFVELNYAGSTQTGTFHNPYRTFATAVQNAPNNSVLFVQPATYARPVTAITKPMVLRAPLGGVRIQ